MIITLTNDLLGTSVNLRLRDESRWKVVSGPYLAGMSGSFIDKWTLSRRQVVRAREVLLSSSKKEQTGFLWSSNVVSICGEHGPQWTKDGKQIKLTNRGVDRADLEIVP